MVRVEVVVVVVIVMMMMVMMMMMMMVVVMMMMMMVVVVMMVVMALRGLRYHTHQRCVLRSPSIPLLLLLNSTTDTAS